MFFHGCVIMVKIIKEHLIFVTVKIEDEDYYFLFDTGASTIIRYEDHLVPHVPELICSKQEFDNR